MAPSQTQAQPEGGRPGRGDDDARLRGPGSGSGAPYDMSPGKHREMGPDRPAGRRDRDLPAEPRPVRIPAAPNTRARRSTTWTRKATRSTSPRRRRRGSSARRSRPPKPTSTATWCANSTRRTASRARSAGTGGALPRTRHPFRLQRRGHRDARILGAAAPGAARPSGELVEARQHTVTRYDEGEPAPPAGTPPAYLPTKETVARGRARQRRRTRTAGRRKPTTTGRSACRKKRSSTPAASTSGRSPYTTRPAR